MCPGAVVILLVRAKHVPQMPLIEHDYMIEALASDRADQSFSVTVLPRRSRRCRSVANAHRANAARKCLAVDTVAITTRQSGTGSHPQASLTCRAIHSAVGDVVMPTQRIRLRSCRRIRRPYNNLNEIIGTTKRSIEAPTDKGFRLYDRERIQNTRRDPIQANEDHADAICSARRSESLREALEALRRRAPSTTLASALRSDASAGGV